MRLAVLGVGLIGGSIGLAARSRAGARVIGHDPDERALAAALELGAIDEAAPSLAEAVAGADVAFVAAPVGMVVDTARAALAAAGPECVVSDVGSTKHAILAAIDDERFVGGHPLTGAESGGVEHARADMFDGATWYLTPTTTTTDPHDDVTTTTTTTTDSHDVTTTTGSVASTSGSPVERLCATIAALGARPTMIDAAAHDRLMAHLSHLPHVFANVLVAGAARALERERRGLDGGLLGAPPSFRDATRVAGANTPVWVDIYVSNADALVEAIDEAIERLGVVRAALVAPDAPALTRWNEQARRERRRMTDAALTADA